MPTYRDNSEMQTYLSCPQRWYYAYCRNLRPKVSALPLVTGTAGHECASEIHLGRPWAPKLAAWKAEQEALLLELPLSGEQQEPSGAVRLFTQADVDQRFGQLAACLATYAEYYAGAPYKVVHQERTFEIRPYQQARTICVGRVDAVVDLNGQPWLLELKTGRQRWPGEQVAMDRQLALYMWGVQTRSLPNLGGVVLVVLVLKSPGCAVVDKPTDRKPKTRARPSGNLASVTDQESLDAALAETGWRPEEVIPRSDGMTYAGLREKLPSRRDLLLQTAMVTYSPEALAAWASHDLRVVIASMEDAARNASRHGGLPRNPGWATCPMCTYRDVCQTEFCGWDASPLIERTYVVSRDPHPYLPEFGGWEV